MDTQRWQRITDLLDDALALPPEERSALLDAACGDDEAVRREVESLLDADAKAGEFLFRSLLDGRGGAVETRRLGPYRILRKLGQGGMSTVYLASRDDDQFQRRVAVKVVRADSASEQALARFVTERQILASFDHPNIARLYDGGVTEEGLPYLVMELIEGEPIDEYCDRHRLSVRERLELFTSVCLAVSYAHQNLVIHRDLKPGNILVTEKGEAKLLDFGIAKLLQPDLARVSPSLTAAWQRLMTPDYASPEQVQGKAVTTASDVYSLGVLLYRLLTGRLPHRLAGRTPREIETIAAEQEPSRPSAAALAAAEDEPSPEAVGRARRVRPEQLRRQLAGDLDNIVLTAMRKEPQRRYSSAERLAEDVRRHLAGLPVHAHPASFGYRAGKLLKRHALAVAATAVSVLLILGAVVLLALQSARIAKERDQARHERVKAQQTAAFLEEIIKASVRERRLDDPHEILDLAAERIDKLGDQPEIQATLLSALGRIYRDLKLYRRAEELSRRALDLRLQTLGPAHADVAESLVDLGQLRGRLGDPEGASDLYRQGRSLQRAERSRGSPALGLTWSKLSHDPRLGIDNLGCTPPCNPYVGDTPCTASRAVLCLQAAGAPNPGVQVNAYRGWSGGHVATTLSVPGTALTSRAEADRLCAESFGAGWRMAEFHHPQGGWNWWAYGNVRTDRRFWIAIDDQPANCWDR